MRPARQVGISPLVARDRDAMTKENYPKSGLKLEIWRLALSVPKLQPPNAQRQSGMDLTNENAEVASGFWPIGSEQVVHEVLDVEGEMGNGPWTGDPTESN